MENIDTRSAILWIANFVYEIDNTTSWLGRFVRKNEIWVGSEFKLL